MSLKKKIALSFFISAFIIAALTIFVYFNFIEIKKEIRYLEITDTIRSKSLQLRRHEKNYFLYPQTSKEESEAVHRYLKELNDILSGSLSIDRTDKLSSLKSRVREYEQRFNRIETFSIELSKEVEDIKSHYKKYSKFFPLLELSLLEHPSVGAEFLEKAFSLPSGHRLIVELRELDIEINALRKKGEDIISISKELDRNARENADKTINLSRMAILVFFPLFFITGISTLFFISRNISNRLNALIGLVEKTGSGHFSLLSLPSNNWGSHDEVGVLTEKFNDMETQLIHRDQELEKKNAELLRTKKLAAIGTLASGVAHELNNPLNNIYISAQILEREVGGSSSPIVKEIVDDIIGQTVRVKQIVGDLLEFARGREPHPRKVELKELIIGAYKLVSTTSDTSRINLTIDVDPDGEMVNADPEQIERVFINLFTNAIGSMSGEGNLGIKVQGERGFVKIRVSDTGSGIPRDAMEKIFEPFYTTKDKGTGLGLAIVFNIIKKHRGEITVESEEGKGTTFTIILPFDRGTQL